MSYGELILPPVWNGRNKRNGQFLPGHKPANKGKKWSEFMPRRSQRNAAKGWKNLKLHRPTTRSENCGRARKAVIAVMDDGSWKYFSYVGAAGEWIGGSRENVARCCRENQSRRPLLDPCGRPTTKVNTNHRYRGVRFYFETDGSWVEKIKGSELCSKN